MAYDDNGFDLQSQLDEQSGYSQDTDFGNYGEQGADYLGSQQSWDFGNYGDQWSNVPQQPSFDFNSNLSNTPGQEWANMGNIQMSPEEYGAIGGQMPTSTNWNPNQPMLGNLGSGTSNFLSSLFSGGNAKGLTSVLGALAEGRQNKKYSNQAQNTIQQIRQQGSPFDQAGGADPTSMRGQMQAQLTNAMQNPYAVPIVKAQTDAIARAQAIKDAAAGRRSNSATSSPAMLASQAQVAQNYINSLYTPAGAGMSAGMGGLEQLLAAQKAGAQGYASPLMSALGNITGTNTNSAQMAALVKALQGGQ